MAADQEKLRLANDDIRFFDVRATCADGFDFPALQHKPSLEAFLDKIIEESFFVIDDTHSYLASKSDYGRRLQDRFNWAIS